MCKVQGSTGITVTGTGAEQDPFILTADTELSALDTTTFNVTVTGEGTAASPWRVSVAYAATAKLDDIPDVNAPTPSNNQVLGWDSATAKWTPRASTTAPTGAVTHDSSLSGDGSVGTPLVVHNNSTRGLETTGAGIGVTDAFMQMLTRLFADATARGSASPAPVLNALSMLATTPGELDYWTGTAWAPIKDNTDRVATGGQMLSISGAYDGSTRLANILKQVNLTTGTDGSFEVLNATDLAGRAGVLNCQFTPHFTSVGAAVGIGVVLVAASGVITGLAYLLSDGTPFSSAALRGSVNAWVY